MQLEGLWGPPAFLLPLLLLLLLLLRNGVTLLLPRPLLLLLQTGVWQVPLLLLLILLLKLLLLLLMQQQLLQQLTLVFSLWQQRGTFHGLLQLPLLLQQQLLLCWVYGRRSECVCCSQQVWGPRGPLQLQRSPRGFPE